MKQRTPLYAFLSVLFAFFLIACATALVTGYSHRPADWLEAQRRPILWLVDFSALYTLVLVAFFVVYERMARLQARELLRLREEHHAQLEQMTAHMNEADRGMEEYEDKIAQMKEETHQMREGFEAEARRLTEQAFQALQGQVEAHARQMEAINLALQYHRGELRELRHNMRLIQATPAPVVRLTPEELAALSEAGSALPTEEAAFTAAFTASHTGDHTLDNESIPPFLLRAARAPEEPEQPADSSASSEWRLKV